MRKLVYLAALVALAALAAAFQTGGGGATASTGSTANANTQREADLYEIDQIEVKFHRATSKHDIALMMSLWAPGAVFNIDQKTLVGKKQIQHWFETENKAFKPGDHWESDTPSYKIKVNLNGDKATMYFECHYIDPKTGLVVALAGVTHTLQKVNGHWLITNSAGSTATLSP
jgi:ketosteroid isomerase-like protein